MASRRSIQQFESGLDELVSYREPVATSYDVL